MAEAAAAKRARAKKILTLLGRAYPDAKIALDFASPFQLIVATILSAQCTDERVNKVTPGLFKKYPTPRAMADADISDLEHEVRSTGFFRNKAKNIKAASRLIVEHHGGNVPQTMEE